MTKPSINKKDVQVLRELLKDSSRSDREIAKTVGASQPTISRIRKRLLQTGAIRSFSAIPNFSKMGFKLMALTFVKIKHEFSNHQTRNEDHTKAQEWLKNQPNVIFSDYCRGLDMNAFSISLHFSYHDFEEFIKKHNQDIGHNILELETVLVDLSSNSQIKPFDFSSLADLKKLEK